jgi:LacI family transcriptional regulator
MIRPEVVARISAVADRLGYRRNAVAAALRLQRSATIGVVVPDITNPVFPPILRAIEDVLTRAGFIAIIANTDNDPARQQMVVERMLERSVDGLILASVTRDDGFLSKINTPLVMINRTVAGGFTTVVSDDTHGIRAAVDHLVALGHRDIAHIAGPAQTSTGFIRQEAFLAAMQAHDMDIPHSAVSVAEQFSIPDGTLALRALLAQRPAPTAIVAANDLLAIGCYDALAQAGLACPADVSVIGFNAELDPHPSL